MVVINFYDLDTIDDEKLAFAVIMTRYKNQWIYVKHKERETWEIPGGHREPGESIDKTASRELYEETGATKFKLTPLCIYSVERDEYVDYSESFGALFYAEVEDLDKLPDYEIGEIELFEDIPKELTYPRIQPFLHKKVLELT